MKKLKKITILIIVPILLLTACKKDLDHSPDNTLTADQAYSSVTGYKNVLAKVYGAYTLTGNNGPGASAGDIDDIDQGQSDFLRLYFNLQELPTEEAIQAQNDPGLLDLHAMNWTSDNIMLRAMYGRCFFHIAVCNEFIRESTDDKLGSRGITGGDADKVRQFRAEARFLRAFQYWVLLDMFGNPAFVTEDVPVGKFIPPRILRKDLFLYIESELKAIEPLLIAARKNEYGRADQATAQALLARLYINSEVYLGGGNGKYTDALTYASKVINAGFTLNAVYKNLFLADNNINNPETILAIPYDAFHTQNWGGLTYVLHAASDWRQMRTTESLPGLFASGDKRAMFSGAKPAIDDVSLFSDGLAVQKYKNVTSAGVVSPSPNSQFVSIDFPLFRLPEMYLVYAEANLRGGGGSAVTGMQYVNLLRTRAFGNVSGNFNSLSLDNILDERARELYWEALRRTDLIRFGKFTTGSYLWPWKGNTKSGREVESYRVLFPISSADMLANPNLVQNEGY